MDFLLANASPILAEVQLIAQQLQMAQSESACNNFTWLLEKFNEPKLLELAKQPNTWAYRIITVTSDPLAAKTSIRIQSTPEGGAQLVYNKTGGTRLAAQGNKRHLSRQLSSTEVAEFRQRLEKLQVFDIPTDNSVAGRDRNGSYFEAVENGQYHCIKRFMLGYPNQQDRSLVEVVNWMFEAVKH